MTRANQRDVAELTAAQAAERVATGFSFTEGPLWLPNQQCLLFSDMPADVRRKYTPGNGVTEVMRPSNQCNGLTLDNEGNLIVCEHATSSVVRESASGARSVLASHYGASELNSPNDVVVKSDGAVYFTDPTFGRNAGFGIERDRQLPFQGVFRVPGAAGDVELMADDFGEPNGLCFTQDESRLYVNDTQRAHIRVFEVLPDGTLAGGDVFADGIGEGDPATGVVDGMKLDEHGHLYVTGPGGVWVFDVQANLLGVLELPEPCANLNWAEEGWQALYFTASTSLYRIPMAVRGNRLGYMERADAGR